MPRTHVTGFQNIKLAKKYQLTKKTEIRIRLGGKKKKKDN